MTCGIYLLTFKSGKLYIGQSVNIEQRWQQHFDKMMNGTAAKLMQAEFKNSGYPSTAILKECHKDHLDMMESMYINSNMIAHKNMMLNTSIPKDYTNAEIFYISNHEEYLKYSIVQLIQQAHSAKANVIALEEEINDLRDSGISLPKDLKDIRKTNKELENSVTQLIKINQELSRRANMTWFERLIS